MTDIFLPEIGEGIEKATVSYIYVKVSDSVKEGEDVVEISTDKATFNVTANTEGIIEEILVSEGDEVKVGDVLLRVSPKE